MTFHEKHLILNTTIQTVTIVKLCGRTKSGI